MDTHTDEERFWRDFARVMSLRSTDKQGAFCIGLVTAIAAFGRGFPSRQILKEAAAQDGRAFQRELMAALPPGIQEALEESVKLQSHYAMLLNGWDGGERRTFANGKEWMARLAELRREPALPAKPDEHKEDL